MPHRIRPNKILSDGKKGTLEEKIYADCANCRNATMSSGREQNIHGDIYVCVEKPIVWGPHTLATL